MREGRCARLRLFCGREGGLLCRTNLLVNILLQLLSAHSRRKATTDTCCIHCIINGCTFQCGINTGFWNSSCWTGAQHAISCSNGRETNYII